MYAADDFFYDRSLVAKAISHFIQFFFFAAKRLESQFCSFLTFAFEYVWELVSGYTVDLNGEKCSTKLVKTKIRD